MVVVPIGRHMQKVVVVAVAVVLDSIRTAGERTRHSVRLCGDSRLVVAAVVVVAVDDDNHIFFLKSYFYKTKLSKTKNLLTF